MGILNLPPELLLWVAEDLSLEDLSSFRSTYNQVWHALTPRFQELCLRDIGELTALQWAAVRSYADLVELAISNGAEIDAPSRGRLDRATLSLANRPDRPDFSSSCILANSSASTEANDSIIRTPLFLAACF